MKARAASLSLGRADALRHPVVINERLGKTVEMGKVDIWIEIFGLANNRSLATAHLTPQSSVSHPYSSNMLFHSRVLRNNWYTRC